MKKPRKKIGTCGKKIKRTRTNLIRPYFCIPVSILKAPRYNGGLFLLAALVASGLGLMLCDYSSVNLSMKIINGTIMLNAITEPMITAKRLYLFS